MLTLLEQFNLRKDADFVGRVEAAVAKLAVYIVTTETLGTNSQHLVRFNWAKSAITNPGSFAQQMLSAVIADPGILATPANQITDVQIEYIVDVLANSFGQRLMGI
jgi:hypothetical protein